MNNELIERIDEELERIRAEEDAFESLEGSVMHIARDIERRKSLMKDCKAALMCAGVDNESLSVQNRKLSDLLTQQQEAEPQKTNFAWESWQAAHARYAGSGGAVTAVVVSSNGIQWAGGETDLNVITRLGLAVGDRLELHPAAQQQVPEGYQL